MNERIARVLGQEALQTDTLVILYIALVFFSIGILVVLILFASRITKSYYENRSQELNKKLQSVLNSIIVNSAASEQAVPDSALQFHISQIRLVILRSPFRKQLLINQLIRLKKNLTGASADILRDVYNRLELEQISLRGLKSFRWFNKARAMRELSEMNVASSKPLIARYLKSRNAPLREEAFISLANLKSEPPLIFLDDYQFPITEWMQLNVHSVLQRIDSRRLPDFSQWFNHSNKSVAMFAIRMAAQFKQYQAADGFKNLLTNRDPEIQFLALKAIHDLEMNQFASDVLLLKDHAWQNEALAKIFVQYLGKVAITNRIEDVLKAFMQHEVYAVRFEATASFLKNSSIESLSGEDLEKSQRMIRHLSEPLLN